MYLLAASRQAIADSLDINYNTFKSFADRVETIGLDGFIDRRRERKTNDQPLPQQVTIQHEPEKILISMGTRAPSYRATQIPFFLSRILFHLI
ncbi:MAG: hypothetical protein U9O87_03605 [Verrucomicrobiota bacterium]|nr:hypothetical protein [Verrucomicrobiota bacterium]